MQVFLDVNHPLNMWSHLKLSFSQEVLSQPVPDPCIVHYASLVVKHKTFTCPLVPLLSYQQPGIYMRVGR